LGNRRYLSIVLFLVGATAGGFAQAQQGGEKSDSGVAHALRPYAPIGEQQSIVKEKANPNCLEWKNEACTVCGIDSATTISLKNMTKTPILLCRDMKPGPAKVTMVTHAEPAVPGIWEVEFGLGYQTSARTECPHQFIASNNPPLKDSYEVGPISIEAEIPQDGIIQVFACIGLSSARVGREGKETAVSLRVLKLRVVGE